MCKILLKDVHPGMHFRNEDGVECFLIDAWNIKKNELMTVGLVNPFLSLFQWKSSQNSIL